MNNGNNGRDINGIEMNNGNNGRDINGRIKWR
jgi:hypothetical protein